jgi:poly(A) polymerase
MLLGKPPKDYDVATDATPEKVMATFPRNVPVGVAFGVVRVLSDDDPPIQVEVATFRGETAYSDGRHPDQVCFTDEKEDVKRRDFTINGLLFDPLNGQVLDHVGGLADIEAKTIRAIGDPNRRFSEDYLRMFRAIRFAARLGFAIEKDTFAAIRDNAERIDGISPERIRDEISLMLTGPSPRTAIEMLDESLLLAQIMPEVDALHGVRQPPDFHPEGDVWIHTMMLLGQLKDSSLSLALGALLHDIGKPPTFVISDRIRFNGHETVGAEMTENIMTRLKFPTDEIERVSSLVRQHMVFKDVESMREAKRKRFLRQDNFRELLELHRIDCIASHGHLTAHEFCLSETKRLPQEALRPARLVTGHDLIEMGLKPSPRFKEILEEIEDMQLEGYIADRDAALKHLAEKAKQ